MVFFPRRKRPDADQRVRWQAHTRRRILFGSIGLLALAFFAARMLSVTPPAEARGYRPMFFRGLIVQVDSSNAQDVTFSTLDAQGNARTFHLVASTQFLPAGSSAAQLAVNSPVLVKARPSYDGSMDAVQVQIQQPAQATVTAPGVVASISKNNRFVALALSDGTMIQASVPTRARLSVGSYVALRGHIVSSGIFQANGLRILRSHVRSFQARVVIEHINSHSHRLTLVTPTGTTFSVIQRQGPGRSRSSTNNAPAIGTEVNITIGIDAQGNLKQQRLDLVNEDSATFTLDGMVIAIDTNASTLTLVDEVGDTAILKADASVLQQVQIGNYYSVEVSPGSDGSLTAITTSADSIDSQDDPITIDGTVQSYDATSGAMSVVSDDGTSFAIQVSDQTMIENEVSDSTTLAVGQSVEVEAQRSTDQGYSALAIDIQDDPQQGN